MNGFDDRPKSELFTEISKLPIERLTPDDREAFRETVESLGGYQLMRLERGDDEIRFWETAEGNRIADTPLGVFAIGEGHLGFEHEILGLLDESYRSDSDEWEIAEYNAKAANMRIQDAVRAVRNADHEQGGDK